MELLNKTIKEISQLLDEKKKSSLEITKEVFKHVKKVEPKIKAFITLTEKEALEQAETSDKLYAVSHKRRSAIDGIPISIKDILCTKDIKTTAGSNMLGDFVPPYDATVVKRLKDAGAVIIGKNNLDAWAHGSSTENSDFFTTRNPWDLERVPGGSSGGSAAAVASGMGFASFGTDTGGSIRQPAALCGVTGLKPTYGRNSRHGLIAMASSLDCPGIFACSAEDIAAYLEIICGKDELDSTTVPDIKFNSKNVEGCKLEVDKLRIGIPKEYFGKGLNSKVKEKIMEAIEVYKKMGAKIVEISLPNTDYALAVYYIIQPAEVSSNLARFDGIKYGFSVEKQVESKKLKVESLIDVYMKSRAYGFGDEAKRRIMIGTYVLSSGYYDAYYKKAMKVRTLVCDDFKKAFKDVDVIITPTTPTTAFKIGEKSKDPLEMYMSDIYTVGANIAGIPGVSIPCGFVESHQPSAFSHQLPVGLQILGPQFSEELILGLAHAYQQKTVWHKETPNM
jgi:aspartyl-tRNA(Asn)/glutamyl-tRNA(Gln) amidotransferase subunit A